MSIDNIYKTDASRLSALMDLDERTKEAYSSTESGAIWRQQLATPLLIDLKTQIRESSTDFESARAASPRPPETFGELLTHPHPPIGLLTLAKDFAKTHAQSKDGVLPQDIALALYFTCIAAALTHCCRRITSLDDGQLRKGFKWASRLTWQTGSIRALLLEALKLIDPAGRVRPNSGRLDER